jgi:hypothetical protein
MIPNSQWSPPMPDISPGTLHLPPTPRDPLACLCPSFPPPRPHVWLYYNFCRVFLFFSFFSIFLCIQFPFLLHSITMSHNVGTSTQSLHADDALNVVSDVAPPLHLSTTFRYSDDPSELFPAADLNSVCIVQCLLSSLSTFHPLSPYLPPYLATIYIVNGTVSRLIMHSLSSLLPCSSAPIPQNTSTLEPPAQTQPASKQSSQPSSTEKQSPTPQASLPSTQPSPS